jgi:hypothetical protein
VAKHLQITNRLRLGCATFLCHHHPFHPTSVFFLHAAARAVVVAVTAVVAVVAAVAVVDATTARTTGRGRLPALAHTTQVTADRRNK